MYLYNYGQVEMRGDPLLQANLWKNSKGYIIIVMVQLELSYQHSCYMYLYMVKLKWEVTLCCKQTSERTVRVTTMIVIIVMVPSGTFLSTQLLVIIVMVPVQLVGTRTLFQNFFRNNRCMHKSENNRWLFW